MAALFKVSSNRAARKAESWIWPTVIHTQVISRTIYLTDIAFTSLIMGTPIAGTFQRAKDKARAYSKSKTDFKPIETILANSKMADLYTGSILTNTELIWATFQHPQMLRTRFILRARVYCSLKMVMSTKVSGNVVSSTAMVLFNMQRARRKMMKNAWDSQNSKGPTKMANDRREL